LSVRLVPLRAGRLRRLYGEFTRFILRMLPDRRDREDRQGGVP
jgi:hypothetical protein